MGLKEIMLLIFGIINSIFELLLLIFTIHMLRTRKDIWKKYSILLLLACINLATISVTLSLFFLLLDDFPLHQIPNHLSTILRDAMLILLTQRLCYLLHSAALIPKAVSNGIYVLLVVHIVVWVTLMCIWQPLNVAEGQMYWYSLSSEFVVNLLYLVVVLRFWTGVAKLMSCNFKCALIVVGLANVIRLIYFLIYPMINQVWVRSGVTHILLSLCHFLATLYFLITIMEPPAVKRLKKQPLAPSS
jgi:hypothetical protein